MLGTTGSSIPTSDWHRSASYRQSELLHTCQHALHEMHHTEKEKPTGPWQAAPACTLPSLTYSWGGTAAYDEGIRKITGRCSATG